jgi:hypothetical protein
VKVGDLVRYMTGNGTLGIIIDGPRNNVFDIKSWRVWWISPRNVDGSAKMGWWDNDRLDVISEGR